MAIAAFSDFVKAERKMTQDVEMKEQPAPSNSVTSAGPTVLQRKSHVYAHASLYIYKFLMLDLILPFLFSWLRGYG